MKLVRQALGGGGQAIGSCCSQKAARGPAVTPRWVRSRVLAEDVAFRNQSGAVILSEQADAQGGDRLPGCREGAAHSKQPKAPRCEETDAGEHGGNNQRSRRPPGIGTRCRGTAKAQDHDAVDQSGRSCQGQTEESNAKEDRVGRSWQDETEESSAKDADDPG